MIGFNENRVNMLINQTKRTTDVACNLGEEFEHDSEIFGTRKVRILTIEYKGFSFNVSLIHIKTCTVEYKPLSQNSLQ